MYCSKTDSVSAASILWKVIEFDPMILVGQLLTAFHNMRRVYWRIFEPTIVGVRALIVRDNRVMLVRHTYLKGWYLPGGKVDRGETAYTALCREVEEECALKVKSAMLRGIYSNKEQNRNDHIILYSVDDFESAPVRPLYKLEIAEADFFDIDRLPDGATPATRRRLAEYRRQEFNCEYW
jgi:8-oxo-dGTP pyrophosphatase MutT (NUDIX family)